jgi:hypothetical protein
MPLKVILITTAALLLSVLAVAALSIPLAA